MRRSARPCAPARGEPSFFSGVPLCVLSAAMTIDVSPSSPSVARWCTPIERRRAPGYAPWRTPARGSAASAAGVPAAPHTRMGYALQAQGAQRGREGVSAQRLC